MLAEFVITFRETLEAALIVGIALAFLARTKNTHLNVHVYLGIAAGVVASMVAGAALLAFFGGLQDGVEQVFEGSLLLVASAMIFSVIVWVLRTRHVARQIEEQLNVQIERKYSAGIALFIALSVFREGVEMVIFLASALLQGSGDAFSSAAGGIGGMAAAVLLGFVLFETSIRVNLKMFFSIANIFLVLFGAGILAHSVHEFQEVHILPAQDALWSTKAVLDGDSFAGGIMSMLFGYNDAPTLLEAGAYLGYLLLFGLASARYSQGKISGQAAILQKPARA